MNVLEGKLTARGMKIGIVVARFNEFITSKLLSGCVDCLLRHEAADEDITVAWVPGAFEIPMAAKKMRAMTECMKNITYADHQVTVTGGLNDASRAQIEALAEELA